jgi:TRAP-type C4-dicarboxylate transport system substrate-binding protein
MPMAEAYDALAKGVAEGILGPNETLKGYKLGEVTAYTTENYGSTYSTAFFVVMNKGRWNSIPKDAQAIIEKTFAGLVWSAIVGVGYMFVDFLC